METKAKDLLQYETIRYAIEGLSKQTKYNYLEKLARFFDDMNLTPDQVIEQRKEDLKSDDNKIRFRWEDKVKAWYLPIYEDYEKQGKSTWTAYDFAKAAMSFFSRNRYRLSFKRGEIKAPYQKRKQKLFPSNEEARAIYGFIESYRDKAMFLLMYQSGINEKDIEELNVEDLPKLEKEPPYYFNWVRAKTRERVQTCIGEDAAHDIKKHLEIQGNPKEGSLFSSIRGSRMTTRFIREALKPSFDKITKAKVKSLRDAYSDALDHANIKADLKKKMMGHAPPGAAKHYETSPYTIIEAYKKAYRFLSVNSYARVGLPKDEIANSIAKILKIVSIEDPLKRTREAMEWIDEIQSVSEDFVGKEPFALTLKKALARL